MTPGPDLKFPTLHFEKELWKGGGKRLAGIDEAGRGAWAGPVYAAAVILPAEPALARTLKGVRDSKQMTPLARQSWAPRIRAAALAWGVGCASSDEIDTLGIVPATRLAARRALEGLDPDALLADFGLLIPEIDLPQTALVKGDCLCLSIAAASVLAKTARDARLCELDGRYPGYGFSRHKGYGTRLHQEAIAHLGLCAIHRKSFKIGEQGLGVPNP